LGGHAFVSAYVTVNVKTVAVVPDEGETWPLLSSGSCDWLEQEPAPHVAVAASRFAMIARERAMRRMIAGALRSSEEPMNPT
jgi:hypothetical protein